MLKLNKMIIVNMNLFMHLIQQMFDVSISHFSSSSTIVVIITAILQYVELLAAYCKPNNLILRLIFECKSLNIFERLYVLCHSRITLQQLLSLYTMGRGRSRQQTYCDTILIN
jgi:hypothetical protein